MGYEGMKEITAAELNPVKFIDWQIEKIASEVRDDKAINALSGGVDSSVVTMLGHKALGENLLTYFIDNGLMRKNEPQRIAIIFKGLGVPVEVIDAQDVFYRALKGLTDPEEKREKGITQPFYRDVFGPLVRTSNAKYLFHGTNLTDVDETEAGIKRQHNIFIQIGIDPEKEFGYKIIEPLVQLRKDGVREVAKALGLPEEIYNRMPFPGPALAARVIGEATPERIAIVREATDIVENIIGQYIKDAKPEPKPFQYLAILHEDRVTGVRDGKRDFGLQIEVRCWDSVDARTAEPSNLPPYILDAIARRLTTGVEGIVSVTYNIATKPTSTIEAI